MEGSLKLLKVLVVMRGGVSSFQVATRVTHRCQFSLLVVVPPALSVAQLTLTITVL